MFDELIYKCLKSNKSQKFTYDKKTNSMLKDGEFWLDGSLPTACNNKEINNMLNRQEIIIRQRSKHLDAIINQLQLEIDNADGELKETLIRISQKKLNI